MVFKRNIKKTEVESFLGSILDPPDLEAVVLRGKDCEVLYANSKASKRMGFSLSADRKCKPGYAKSLPDLCASCPLGEKEKDTVWEPFEIIDRDGHVYSAKFGSISWIDGKAAAILFMRDITKEKRTIRQLYSLAYTDHLTGIPNRQRLKEDFAELEDRIANDMLAGAIALFDLDNFKEINDAYGHNTGDVVLRRLAEHINSEKEFAGHLYRLGGDEFVLLFTDPPDSVKTDEEMADYYNHLLSATLQSYTLPNIELECTISMGVSFFPKHGQNLSELLRKADIALYKAKDAGRNQMVLFADRYDIAQKFKDLYINIQPVLLASGKTFGYELIDSGVGEMEGGDTVSLSEFNRALDALGLNEIENNMQYFIAYSKQLLNPAVLSGLPRGKFIVQMRLSGRVKDNDLKIFGLLRNAGYHVALNGLHTGKTVPEVYDLIDYCKFNPEDKNTMAQKRIISDHPRIKFIATGVDTQAAFDSAKSIGFQLFQGFFFSHQPAVLKKTKEIAPMKANYFRLLKLSSTDDYMDFREISDAIASDVALTYKLLSILNSAAVGLRNVSSVAMALAYLGEESLKRWISVLALRGIAEDKPLELVRISLIRARFGELLAPHFRTKRDPNQLFMVGMLSLLHIALEKSKEDLFDEIHISNDVRQSLMTAEGKHSDILVFFKNYEYANWDEVTRFTEENQLDAQIVNDSYIDSVKWYNSLENAK